MVESEEEGRRLGDLLVEPELPGFLRPREVGSSSEEDDLDFDLDLPNLNFFMVGGGGGGGYLIYYCLLIDFDGFSDGESDFCVLSLYVCINIIDTTNNQYCPTLSPLYRRSDGVNVNNNYY